MQQTCLKRFTKAARGWLCASFPTNEVIITCFYTRQIFSLSCKMNMDVSEIEIIEIDLLK